VPAIPSQPPRRAMSEITPSPTASREAPWKRSFWSLIATQFQGAFSDNLLKWFVTFLILSTGLSPSQRDWLVVLVVPLLFAVPFLLFSMSGGFLADRFSKRSVTVWTKVMEFGAGAVAVVGLARGSVELECAAIFLFGAQAALFGPSKYGLLPELLPEKRLSWGNGILELGTFLAIILGTVAAGELAEIFRPHPAWTGVLLLGLTGVGLTTSLSIARVRAANPARRFRANPLGDLRDQVREIRKDRVLGLAVLGNMYFWFLGALLVINIVLYANDVLKIPESQASLLLATASIGIGVGSFIAGWLSGGKIEYGLIPLGALGITVMAALLSLPGLTFAEVAVRLGWLGFFSGFFAVPINALIQHRPEPERKGGVIAAANLLSFVGIALQPVAQFLLIRFGHPSPSKVFLLAGLLTLVATAYAAWLVPDSLLRLLLWLGTHSMYRIRVEGRDNIPERGGALFVSNHISFLDALLVLASTDRQVRFLMARDDYELPFIRPFVKILGVIPVSPEQRPRELVRSLGEASQAIASGQVVCIFAEGQISRIGQLLPFRRGLERIMEGLEVPIVPLCLDGVWGSIFSFERGRFLWKFPHRIPYPVTVTYGRPLAPTATAAEVRQAVQELQSEAYQARKARMKTLDRRWIAAARRHPFRFAMADGHVPRLRSGAALTGAILLARRLRPHWQGQRMVGILLPPSVPGALANFAALLAGKIPVNLNCTVSADILASCARQCELETVVTSSAFLAHLKVELPCRPILLEQAAAGQGLEEKLRAGLLALLPAGWLERALGREKPALLDDPATVIFSSGTTGDPKGVVLSHYNIGSNVDQIAQTFMLRARDRLLGSLPFFHSFGFTVTLWLPALLGVGVVYSPSPLDAAAIGALVRDYRATVLLSTPTFLQGYIRKCPPKDFGSLQFVMVGAEKLPERVAVEFEDRFGIRPFEGYGCTECSPVVAVNTRDFRAAGFRQVGAKRGRIGHPLPGVSVRIVDPETLQPVPLGQSGLLLVRGPNVMQGYLGRAEKTAEVLQDSWYITGDVARLDEDGFLAITDRLSRFSKIGGEMVPHVLVEERLEELVGASEKCFVVSGVPDEKKGERLVVLHTLAPEKLAEVLEKLPGSGLPNLWTPRPNQFFHIEALPVLGSGKLDLRKVRELACRLSAANGAA
jgi:acyl-[acyl-carrier-protein]-phospholipid O-acyltransferase/long-chain-fatty-acid--[acyl-carrier-protein] ligase